MDSGPLVQANNPTVREMQPANGDFGRTTGPPDVAPIHFQEPCGSFCLCERVAVQLVSLELIATSQDRY